MKYWLFFEKCGWCQICMQTFFYLCIKLSFQELLWKKIFLQNVLKTLTSSFNAFQVGKQLKSLPKYDNPDAFSQIPQKFAYLCYRDWVKLQKSAKFKLSVPF